jgi:phage terminase large subunit
LDVPKSWLGNVFINQAESLKLSNPEAYDNEYGGIVNGFGNLVFTNVAIRTITDEEIYGKADGRGRIVGGFDNILNGLDFGYIHPAHYSKVHFDAERLELFIFGEVRKYKTSNKDLYDVMIEAGYRPQDLLIADSAEPKSISELANYGAYIMGATKGNDSVKFSIKFLQSLRKIIIDPNRCPYAAQEFQNFAYLMNKDGEVIEAFPDVDDDSIASVRYATNTYWIRAGQ